MFLTTTTPSPSRIFGDWPTRPPKVSTHVIPDGRALDFPRLALRRRAVAASSRYECGGLLLASCST